jgi:hypothetical protein
LWTTQGPGSASLSCRRLPAPPKPLNPPQQLVCIVENSSQPDEVRTCYLTFTTRHVTCPPVFLHNTLIPVKYDVKYLGLHLDSKLTWRKHIQTKRQHLNLKLWAMSWPLGRRSQLSLPNKLLLYKCILKPVWTYGIQH